MTNSSQPNRLEQALSYAERGWHVFPVWEIKNGVCACGKGSTCTSPGKHPRTPQGLKDASSDPAVIRSWWATWPTANVAIATGPPHLLVIDIDPRKDGESSWDDWEHEHGQLPETLTALTSGGGRHLVFHRDESQPFGNRTNWLPGVDVKADGGYIVAPPSQHISGDVYRWKDETVQPLPLPPVLFQSLLQGSAGSSTRGELPDTSNILKGVDEGSRDDVLFRACCRWRNQLDDSREAVTVLALTAARNCTPPFPDDQARKCVDSVFKQVT